MFSAGLKGHSPRAMRIRLKELRESLGLTQEQMAEEIGLSVSYYNRMENASRPISSKWLDKIASHFKIPVTRILSDDSATSRVAVQEIVVRGAVQAGVWVQAVEWPEEDRYAVVIPRLTVNARNAYGLEVRGPSMNLHYPEKAILICVPLAEFWREIKDTDHVVVERRGPDGSVEATVKELMIDDDGRAWLWPRSRHPAFQQPLEVPWPPESWDDGEPEIIITAVVVGSYVSRI